MPFCASASNAQHSEQILYCTRAFPDPNLQTGSVTNVYIDFRCKYMSWPVDTFIHVLREKYVLLLFVEKN